MICNFSNTLVHFVFCQLNFIVLFQFLIKYYHILLIIILSWLGSHCCRDFFLSCLLYFFPYSSPLILSFSSVPLSYFSLAVPMRECLGKHSCMSSPFPIAIMNCTSSFLSLVLENINMPSGHYYRFVPEAAIKNHIIKIKSLHYNKLD